MEQSGCLTEDSSNATPAMFVVVTGIYILNFSQDVPSFHVACVSPCSGLSLRILSNNPPATGFSMFACMIFGIEASIAST